VVAGKTFRFTLDTRIEVNQEVSAFGSNNNEIILQIGENPGNDYIVNWGDGTVPEHNAKSHVYKEPGEYFLAIKGEILGGIRFSVEVEGSVHGEKRLTRATGALPAMADRGMLRNLFYDCTNLTVVGESLFIYNPAATSFEGTFAGCGMKSVPENLFACNPKVTNFSSTFIDCQFLQAIPENLFAKNSAVKDFSFIFCGCLSLQGIPENLFAQNSAVTDFSGTFMFCSSVTGLLPRLWLSHPSAAHMSTFSGCDGADNFNDAADAGWVDF